MSGVLSSSPFSCTSDMFGVLGGDVLIAFSSWVYEVSLPLQKFARGSSHLQMVAPHMAFYQTLHLVGQHFYSPSLLQFF
ncbi:hypothetical protein HanRHA438_Chr02g0087861 [Helianthus annuus]|nr:hypothetical protein HanRHA438_Chr02g0087861 [Helianthus annuus]